MTMLKKNHIKVVVTKWHITKLYFLVLLELGIKRINSFTIIINVTKMQRPKLDERKIMAYFIFYNTYSMYISASRQNTIEKI